MTAINAATSKIKVPRTEIKNILEKAVLPEKDAIIFGLTFQSDRKPPLRDDVRLITGLTVVNSTFIVSSELLLK